MSTLRRNFNYQTLSSACTFLSRMQNWVGGEKRAKWLQKLAESTHEQELVSRLSFSYLNARRFFFVHKMRTLRRRKITTDIACKRNSHEKLIVQSQTGFSLRSRCKAAKKFHCTTAKPHLLRSEAEFHFFFGHHSLILGKNELSSDITMRHSR